MDSKDSKFPFLNSRIVFKYFNLCFFIIEVKEEREIEYGCCDYLLIGLSFLGVILLFPIALFAAIKVNSHFI